MCRRLRQPREHLQRTGEVELGQLGEYDKADIEERHFLSPLVLKRARNSAGDTPIIRAKARSMRRKDPNPELKATVSTLSAVSSSLRRARSMRTRSTKSAGLTFKLDRNSRLSERREIPASCARKSVFQSFRGFLAIFSASASVLALRDDCAASSDENWLCPPGRIRYTT